MPEPIKLSDADARDGLKIWLEVERLHALQHAAEDEFARWANAMVRLYGITGDYVIGDPTVGFLPKPGVTHDG